MKQNIVPESSSTQKLVGENITWKYEEVIFV